MRQLNGQVASAFPPKLPVLPGAGNPKSSSKLDALVTGNVTNPCSEALTRGFPRPNVDLWSSTLTGSSMTKYSTSHKLLLAAWLLFCGGAVAGLMFVIGWVANDPVDPLLALLLGVAAIAFVWMLSSGWEEADLFRKALHMYFKEHRKRDA
jgi:hypothetical protein